MGGSHCCRACDLIAFFVNPHLFSGFLYVVMKIPHFLEGLSEAVLGFPSMSRQRCLIYHAWLVIITKNSSEDCCKKDQTPDCQIYRGIIIRESQQNIRCQLNSLRKSDYASQLTLALIIGHHVLIQPQAQA
jgi:hypothetical protein